MTEAQQQGTGGTPASNDAGVDVAGLQQQIEKKEQEVQAQLDRIYSMVQEGKAASFVQIEFKRTVERISEKYQLLLTLLESNKKLLGSEEYTRRDQELRDQYKQDVVLLAAAIDDAMGVGQSTEDTSNL